MNNQRSVEIMIQEGDNWKHYMWPSGTCSSGQGDSDHEDGGKPTLTEIMLKLTKIQEEGDKRMGNLEAHVFQGKNVDKSTPLTRNSKRKANEDGERPHLKKL